MKVLQKKWYATSKLTPYQLQELKCNFWELHRKHDQTRMSVTYRSVATRGRWSAWTLKGEWRKRRNRHRLGQPEGLHLVKTNRDVGGSRDLWMSWWMSLESRRRCVPVLHSASGISSLTRLPSHAAQGKDPRRCKYLALQRKGTSEV